MILDNFKLNGKVAVVTGANTGLGQGMAIALAEAGADIVGVGRSNMDATKVAVEKAGVRFLPVYADLLTVEPINGVIDAAVKEFGKIDILINNAGIIRRQDAIEFSMENWDDVMDTNLKTLFFFCQAAAKQFMKQESKGKIINVASMLSYQGGIRVPSYTASKSAVMGITKALANEWAKFGINVNAIAPGYMVTNNTRQLTEDPIRTASILERIPAGKWGTPADMGGAAVFLSSEASDYVHGYTMAVDGGWQAR